MTDKPNFSLKKVNKPNCSSGWNELHFAVGWNPNSIWEPNVIIFNNDELEELRRVLDIGMGDCDHCPAWEPYIRDCVLGKKVISCDMIRLENKFTSLAKLIDDLKVDLERVKTDMAVMKFALTTHMGMSHEQNK